MPTPAELQQLDQEERRKVLMSCGLSSGEVEEVETMLSGGWGRRLRSVCMFTRLGFGERWDDAVGWVGVGGGSWGSPLQEAAQHMRV